MKIAPRNRVRVTDDLPIHEEQSSFIPPRCGSAALCFIRG